MIKSQNKTFAGGGGGYIFPGKTAVEKLNFNSTGGGGGGGGRNVTK